MRDAVLQTLPGSLYTDRLGENEYMAIFLNFQISRAMQSQRSNDNGGLSMRMDILGGPWSALIN